MKPEWALDRISSAELKALIDAQTKPFNYNWLRR